MFMDLVVFFLSLEYVNFAVSGDGHLVSDNLVLVEKV